jgi:MGT family glycosyltransferase
MSKIIFFNLPGHGHVNPTLPVVAELVQQGQHVIYYNAEDFRSKIERTGAEFRPYPEPNPTPEKIAGLVSSLVDVTIFLFSESDRLLPFLLAELEQEQPDLVIYDSITLWGMQAAHLLNFPTMASISTFVQEDVSGIFMWRDYLHLLRHALGKMPQIIKGRRRLVQTYGSDVFPHKDIFPCIGDTNLVYTSQEFQPATPFVDDTFHFVGPSINTEAREAVDFPWELLDNGRSRIYISLGTIHNMDPAFYNTMFTTFTDHPGQFILSAGPKTDIGALGSIPDNFIVRQSVPQLELLPKIDAFITHAGMNSVNEGLYYGVPLVAIPQHLEQLLNARVAARHGAAIVLGDRPPYGRFDPHHLRQAVGTVLTDPSYQQNAKRVGDSFRAAGGYETAVQHILSRLKHGISNE